MKKCLLCHTYSDRMYNTFYYDMKTSSPEYILPNSVAANYLFFRLPQHETVKSGNIMISDIFDHTRS